MMSRTNKSFSTVVAKFHEAEIHGQGVVDDE